MKIISLLLALCLPVLASEEDKAALRVLLGVYEKAIASRDLAPLKPHLAADFTAVMLTADEVKDYDGILAYWEKVEKFLGEDGTYQVTVDPDATLFEGNLAVAKGRAREQVVRGGKAFEFTSQWTAVARKEGGTWKIVRIHATIDPIKNPLVAALQGYKHWFIGLGALAVGGIAGRLLPRRKSSFLPVSNS